MKTLNNIIIVTTTIIMVAIMALLTSFTASANVYEDRLKEAFDNITNAVPLEDLSQMHTAYTDPETGIKEGQLDVIKFTIGSKNMNLINNAKRIYEQMNGNSTADIYTLWWNDNDDGTFQGYRLYYSPENAITVGLDCDHCYTVGFLTPNDKQHRTTYTIEWSEDVDDGISGRIVTTYAPIKPKATDGMRISSAVMSPDDYDKYMAHFQAGMEKYQEGMEKYRSAMEKAQGSLEKAQGALSRLSDGNGHSHSFSSSGKKDAKSWMQKLLFYVEKLQDNGSAHYLYLSKLYELCKDTEGLDQTDLKIGMQQLASIYKKLKAKNELKENELQFLESMVDLLESKTKK
ncbi:MAG: hypothetical protein IKH25_03640 [Muribaculaceae bacterium]|nr:hypothetical protein [Muribaculaceae bacterium]